MEHSYEEVDVTTIKVGDYVMVDGDDAEITVSYLDHTDEWVLGWTRDNIALELSLDTRETVYVRV